MATVSRKAWNKYIADLRKISDKAADEAEKYIKTHSIMSPAEMQRLIEYAYALATKYGEAADERLCLITVNDQLQ